MTWRANVTHDFAMDGVAIIIANDCGGDSINVLKPTEQVMESSPRDVYIEPSLRIPDALGRALYDALAAHYAGTSDIRALRADLDQERRRTDRLIEHLAAAAQQRLRFAVPSEPLSDGQ